MTFDNLMGYILSIYQCVCKISLQYSTQAILTFSEFGAWQNLDRWKLTFHNLFGSVLIISMLMQKSINILNSVQEIRPFSLFQNLALSKASSDDKCHFAIVSLFFRIWTSSKTQPISNVIWQSHGVHLVNIIVYAKFHHNIPLSSRDSAIITFSEFGARHSLDQWKMSFRNLLGSILSISMFTQEFIKIFHSI